ncbi:hypothetical protein [Sinorhizobium fredii]|uniref:hypothetical protein n=1 Tax=Rhizobium fredii TaxID=380 RepID=UPI0004AD6DA1|nr:hypothetical protein [Sinorhizobium fredii]
MADAFEFSIELGKLAEELTTGEVQQLTKKLALAGLKGVVMKSPVDKGTFRGNWNVSIHAPDVSTTETADKSGDVTIAKGEAVIAAAAPYQAIHISNGLAYGPSLENGHSKQAPQGMVALTYAELQSMFSGD